METEQKCSRYETIQYDVINFSHKQLSSGHMISIPVSLFPLCMSIEMAQRVLGTLTVFWTKGDGRKKHFVDFLHACVRKKTLKAELEHQVYRLLYIQPLLNVFVLKQVIEDCRC